MCRNVFFILLQTVEHMYQSHISYIIVINGLSIFIHIYVKKKESFKSLVLLC